MKPIKAIPYDLRPREKLLSQGVMALTNAELIAIVLNIGTKNQDVLEIAEKVFPLYTQSPLSMSVHPTKIQQILHIPLTHACKVVACFELAKRMQQKAKTYIFSEKDVVERYHYLAQYTKEHVIGIYVNARSQLIHEEVISIGTTDESLISTKDVYEPAIIHHAIGVIVCHNHPSGSPEPSKEDLDITRKLIEAGNILHIRFLGHVIIGKQGCKSIPLL